MQIKDLAREPKLQKITLDNKEIVDKYKEPLEFYMYDRQPMDVFLKLAAVDGQVEPMFEVIQGMILDDKGKPVITGKNTLPMDVMLALINKVVEELGNLETQTIQG